MSSTAWQPPLVDPGQDGVRVDEPGVFANFYPAKHAGKRPGILLLGGSEGGLGVGPTRQAVALAAHGFAVLHLAYFAWPNGPMMLVSIPLETFMRGIAWLRAHQSVDARRVSIVGVSKGAEAALLTATRDPTIKAVVAGAPSSVSWAGINFGPETVPSWTVAGAPIPFLPLAFDARRQDIFKAHCESLQQLHRHQDAVIPVERLGADLLLVCGEADTVWPASTMAEQIATRLKEHGFQRRCEVDTYSDAGHAVFGPPVEAAKLSELELTGGSGIGNHRARINGWTRVLQFLDDAFG